MNAADEKARQWADFDASMKRSVKERIERSIVHTFKPGLDEPGARVFDSMEDYDRWCKANLPSWLGFGRVTDEGWERAMKRAMGQ